MAATAATALVEIRPTGTASVQGAFGAVKKAAEDLGRQGSTALRTVAQSAASVVDMGKLSAGSLATMLGQLGDLAVGFGAAGPVVGALAVASGAMIKLFVDSREEIRKTREAAEEELLRLRFSASSTGTVAAAQSKFVDLAKAQDALADANQKLATARRAFDQAGDAATAQAFADAQDAQTKALAKVNELQREQTALAKLAAHQFDLEVEARKRLAELEKQRLAATPEGRAKALADEVTALATLAKAHRLTGDDMARVLRLQDELTAATRRGTAATRAAAQANLDKLTQSGALPGLGAGPRVNPITAAFGGPATADQVNASTDKQLAAQQKSLNSRIHVTVQGVIDQARAQAILLRATLAETFSQGVASGMVQGIAAGFQAAFRSGKIGDGFVALGKALLSGIGGAMVQFGEAALMASTLMQSIQTALQSFLPGAGIVASLAMIALGSALQALGGAASSSFGNMGSFAAGTTSIASAPVTRPDDIMRTTLGPTSATTAAGMTPVQPVHITVIGPNDPQAQRTIVKLVTNAQRRGITA